VYVPVCLSGSRALLVRAGLCVRGGVQVELISAVEIKQLGDFSQIIVALAFLYQLHSHTHTVSLIHTHPFNGPLSGTTQVSQYQKGKTNLDFTEARDSEWQWHQLEHMQVCTSLQTDNHASTPPLSFLQAGCPSCCPTNSVKALKANCFTDNAR